MTYLRPALDNKWRRAAIREACVVLKRHEFDSIAVRGTSGLLVGPAVADRLNKRLVVVRKGAEGHHSDRTVETPNRDGDAYRETVSRYVIIDDFISEGETVRAIIKEVKRVDKASQLVGAFRYHAGERYGHHGDEALNAKCDSYDRVEYDNAGTRIYLPPGHADYIHILDNGSTVRETK